MFSGIQNKLNGGHDKMKKIISLMIALALCLSVMVVPAMADDSLSVAIVVAGTLGDRSFYDSANEGLQQLAADLGVTPKVFECREDASLYESSLVDAAENYDVVAAAAGSSACMQHCP